MTVACINVTECVLHPESFKNRLDSARKVCAHMSKVLGLSKEDLPANLVMKFNDFMNSEGENLVYCNLNVHQSIPSIPVLNHMAMGQAIVI